MVSLPPPMLCCPIMSASDLRYHPHSSAMHASLLCSISPKLAKAWAGAPGWGADPSLHWLGSARGQIAVCQIACMPDRPNGASGASGANPNVPQLRALPRGSVAGARRCCLHGDGARCGQPLEPQADSSRPLSCSCRKPVGMVHARAACGIAVAGGSHRRGVCDASHPIRAASPRPPLDPMGHSRR